MRTFKNIYRTVKITICVVTTFLHTVTMLHATMLHATQEKHHRNAQFKGHSGCRSGYSVASRKQQMK